MMLDAVFQTLEMSSLVGALVTTFLAGLIYGFAGFGPALIYMPMATIWLPLPVAFAAFSVSAVASFFTVVPRALPHVERLPTAVMILAAFVTAPLGIMVLKIVPQDPLRWLVAAVVAATLLLLMTGWRYEARPGWLARIGVGTSTGVVGGATGLMGPVIVLFHLGGQGSAEASRAGSIVFLTTLSFLFLPQLAFQGLLTQEALTLGVIQLIPYAIGTTIGQALFQPGRERLYRNVAYALIGLAVLLGVPKPW